MELWFNTVLPLMTIGMSVTCVLYAIKRERNRLKAHRHAMLNLRATMPELLRRLQELHEPDEFDVEKVDWMKEGF